MHKFFIAELQKMADSAESVVFFSTTRLKVCSDDTLPSIMPSPSESSLQSTVRSVRDHTLVPKICSSADTLPSMLSFFKHVFTMNTCLSSDSPSCAVLAMGHIVIMLNRSMVGLLKMGITAETVALSVTVR
jgi:hypothetical protein